MPKLTLSMIVKNEEKYLEGCLESVKEIVDEIVIVDTGSTDKTLDIAKKYSASVYHFDWINDFSAARNFALSNSTGEWILYLDADERLTVESIKELKSIIESREKVGFYCTINNIDEKTNSPKLMRYIRLFKNSEEISFTGKAHEQIEKSLSENGYAFKESKIEITHLGYNVSEEELKEKAERNLNPLLEEYEHSKSSYYAFQLANTYKVLDDKEKELYYHKLAIKGTGLKSELKVVSYAALTDNEIANLQFDAALKYSEEGLKLNNKNSLLNLLTAQAYSGLRRGDLAIKHLRIANNENRRLFNEKHGKNSLTILIDEEKITYYGLYLSMLYSDNNAFGEFLKLMSGKPEYHILMGILENRELSEKEVQNIGSCINEENLDFYLQLLKGYSQNQKKIEIYLSLFEKFEKNSKFLSNVGLVLSENGLLEEAEGILETALALEQKDPSAVFYLISVYLQNEKYNKIGNVIEIAEKEFGTNPEIMQKLVVLKKKLNGLI